MKLLVSLLGLLAISAVAFAASAGRRVWVPECNKAVYKPRQLLLACGDGTNYLAKLEWTRWGTRSATGTGVDEVDDCTPDCARGHFHGYPAAVTLSGPRRCAHVKHQRDFARIVLQYSAAHPGTSSTFHAQLACPF